MSKVAFLGLGAMGSRMAANLAKAGYDLTVWNRSPNASDALRAAGARVAESPRDAASGKAIIVSMLTDDDAARSVWLDRQSGAIHCLDKGAIAIESSTVTPGWIAELSGSVRQRGASLLDAPVAGSRPQAEAGELAYLVGGDADTLDEARPVLDVMGGKVVHLGPNGRGAQFKLVINALFGIQVAAFAELLAFLERAGFDRAQTTEMLASLPVTSPIAANTAKLMLSDSYPPMFPIDLVEKDLGYAVASAKAVGSNVPTTQAVQRVFSDAKAKGYGADNIAGLAQLFDPM
ncbi:MAG: NAD(P)-dependent oxidoreductase [Pseudomonadota bacterium]